MTSVSADDLLPDELAALMHFYAEAGVSSLLEDEPVDRFAEFVAQAAARSPQRRTQSEDAPSAANAIRPARSAAAPVVAPAPPVAIPDAEAVDAARSMAAAADGPAALVAALEAFSACNLKFSARHTVFASGDFKSKIVVVGGMPAADDDREGKPFSGSAGQILSRMMSGIGIDLETVLLANLIPWRTPGDRAPTAREVDICRPFALRMIELVQPAAVLVLGNLAVRMLSGQPRAGIHAARGKWMDPAAVPTGICAFSTFHPQEMLATPACKRLAWQDLLRFKSDLGEI